MPASPKKTRARKRPDYSRPLTREKIAAAAIEVVRGEGQAALSMRKVAGLFGVDVAALYRHFQNKDELLAAVGQLASEMIDLEAPTTGTWEERFLELGKRIRKSIAQHPELGIYGGNSPWATPFFARANGLIAALLCEAGLKDTQLVFATQTVLHLVTSMAQSEVMTRGASSESNRAFALTIYDQLPEEVRKAWPSTSARHDWSVDFDGLFEFALKATLGSIVPDSLRT